MNHVVGNSMDEILIETIKEIKSNGMRVNPRGMWIREILGYSFTLLNPRNRLIFNSERKFSLDFAIGELLWYLRGSNRCEIVSYYNSRYVNYSDDGQTLNGAYGKRIFSPLHNGKSQWDMIVEKLKSDPCSRQALISIYGNDDIFVESKDIPCTSSIQFFIRENKLNCIVHMRSNDLIWGTCYDVFNFTMMQELLAAELNLELGWYKHFVGSMHIYDYHNELAEKILNNEYTTHEMSPMPAWNEEAKEKLFECEEQYRLGYDAEYKCDEYWGNICKLLRIYSIKKHKKNDEIAKYINELPIEYKYFIKG